MFASPATPVNCTLWLRYRQALGDRRSRLCSRLSPGGYSDRVYDGGNYQDAGCEHQDLGDFEARDSRFRHGYLPSRFVCGPSLRCRDQSIRDQARGSRNRAQSRRRPQTLQTHEMQRPKMCARAGSATRLNAGSHPTGGCDLTATAGDETLEVRFSVSGNRSPLFVRLTETARCVVLAAPGCSRQRGMHQR